MPSLTLFEEKQGKQVVTVAELEFYTKKEQWTLTTEPRLAYWLDEVFPGIVAGSHNPLSLQQIKTDYESKAFGNFDAFIRSYIWRELKENGLLIV